MSQFIITSNSISFGEVLLIYILLKIFDVLQILIMIHILLSWVPINNDFKKLVDGIVNPMLKPFRAVIPLGNMGGIDIAPLVLFLILNHFHCFSIHKIFVRNKKAIMWFSVYLNRIDFPIIIFLSFDYNAFFFIIS